MFKLIKYELKSMYKSILGIVIAIGVLSMLSGIIFFVPDEKAKIIYTLINSLILLVIGIATFVILFINCIKSMSKYLYGSDGYLMFTTPQSGYSIIGSRLIVSLIQIAVVLAAFLVFVYFTLIKGFMSIANLEGMYDIVINAFDINWQVTIIFILDFILGFVSFLLTVYFSMILGKSIIPIRKHEKLVGFITFIVINSLLNYMSYKISRLITIDIPINGICSANGSIGSIFINNNVLSIGFSSTIFNIIVCIIFFFASSYLIDNKIEL